MTKSNQEGSSHFLWLAAGMAFGVVIALALVAIFVIYNTGPALNIQPSEATPMPYGELDRFGKEVIADDQAEKLCSSHYPIDANSRNQISYWEIQGDNFIIKAELYPDIDLPTGKVQFTKTSAMVTSKVAVGDGLVNLVPVTDQNLYDGLVQQALRITDGNRGFMAYWVFQIHNGKPVTDQTISGCQAIPFQK